MTNMGLSLEEIKIARLKLEGIGLLKTYYLEGNINSYLYELYSPVSASEFFSHPIFNIVLYNNVGKNEYERLINFFKMPNISLKEYADITSSFDSVFVTKNYTKLEVDDENLVTKNKLLLNYELDYDFDLLLSLIPKNMFNEKCLNKSNKELITHLSFLYEIDPIDMADLIVASLNEKGNIDKDSLRKSIRKFYQVNNENRLPSLLFKSQPEYLKSAKGDNSNRGRIIKVFENITPYEFLRSKYKGAKPSARDMNILENLLIDIKLNPAVVNVLVDYVLRTSNNKLVKNFIETIAGQWKRNGIETADEAMKYAESEYKKAHKKENVSKKEIIPAWFNKNIESDGSNDTTTDDFNSFIEEFRR